MTSGQRFRRRALRRGYKVDEVDSFLERVEATIAGEPVDAPVTAQEVHDVQFRVRFGGYDEWQVDLHLDRVERQLTEAAAHAQPFGPPERMAPPERMMPPQRMAPPERMMATERMPAPPERLPAPPERMGPPDRMRPPERMGAPAPPPPMGARPAPPGFPAPPEGGFGPYDEPTYGGGFDSRPGVGGTDRMSDMTSEMRLGEPPRAGEYRGGQPPSLPRRQPGTGMGGQGMPPPPPPPMSTSIPAAGYEEPAPPELQRVDQLRRTFQPRRFGSGYDRGQVDRLFEEVLVAMAGRGPLPLGASDLDPRRFDLVPGGYFEAEVDAALHELREILLRR